MPKFKNSNATFWLIFKHCGQGNIIITVIFTVGKSEMKVQAFVTFQSSNATCAVALAIGITSFGWVGHWSIRIAIAIIYKNKLKLLKCTKVLIPNTLIQNSCQSSWKQEEGSEDYQAGVHVDQLRTYQTLKHRLESHRTRNFQNNIK